MNSTLVLAGMTGGAALNSTPLRLTFTVRPVSQSSSPTRRYIIEADISYLVARGLSANRCIRHPSAATPAAGF